MWVLEGPRGTWRVPERLGGSGWVREAPRGFLKGPLGFERAQQVWEGPCRSVRALEVLDGKVGSG